MVKEFEEDAGTILSKFHHNHTESNVAQHELVTLTPSQVTTCKFLSQFKEKLHLLVSLVPHTDNIPETVRITFLQRAVHKNHDLRRIHVPDSVWRSKTGSTGKFIFEVYYDLLWNAAYQHDLNNAEGQKKREAFISQQVDSFDESDHVPGEDSLLDQDKDDSSPSSNFQCSFNSPEPQNPTKIFISNQLWGEFPEPAKKLIIE